MAREPGINAVPHTPTEDLCLDFVNSRFHDHRGTGAVYDRLPLQGWWEWLVARWELGPCPVPDAPQLAALRRLRTLSRLLLEDASGPRPRDVAALNRVLAAAPQAWHVAGSAGTVDVGLRPVTRDVASVAAAVVVSLVDVLAAGRDSIHACENPSCSFLFRDTSRNGSRRWCDAAICGNLVKVRAFRAGQRPGGR